MPAAPTTAIATASAADYTLHTWQKLRLTDEFWGEGAHVADINRDGQLDVLSGPYWYAGPDFKTRHEYAPTTRSSPAGKAPFTRKTADGKEEQVPGFEGGGLRFAGLRYGSTEFQLDGTPLVSRPRISVLGVIGAVSVFVVVRQKPV